MPETFSSSTSSGNMQKLTSSPARHSSAWQTPLYEQFWGLKDQAPEALLFFRLGDFYELFGDDALIAAPLLEIQLTARNKNHEDPIPMCGVPVSALESYAEKILGAGLKIAIADQVEEAGKGKKLVERDIVRILTPGLPIDFEKLDAKEANWLVAIARKPRSQSVEISVFDLLSSRLHEGLVDDAEALQNLLQLIRPREVLLETSLMADPKALQQWGFDESVAEAKSSTLPMAHWTPWGGASAHQNLVEYLCFTQRKTAEQLGTLLPDARGLTELNGLKNPTYAHLPQSVLEQWAVLPELFDLLDACGSAVGSRRLKQLLSAPLVNVDRIQTRQKLLKDALDFSSILQHSKSVYDLERLLGRFRLEVASPLELIRFKRSLNESLSALSTIDPQHKDWNAFLRDEGLEALPESQALVQRLSEKVNDALVDEVEIKKGITAVDLIRPGFDPEIDRLHALRDEGAQWLNGYQEKLRSETGIPSLKVRNNKVFGYYVEVTKTHLAKVPDYFDRKQTTANGERFTTEELRNRERDILSSASALQARSHDIFESLVVQINEVDEALKIFLDAFAWADCFAGVLKSINKLRALGEWNWPDFVEKGPDSEVAFLKIEDGRHPILEAMYRDFVPNSIELSSVGNRCMLLTGPNMAGKSTLMRQTGLCLLLGQCGLPVSATQMQATPSTGFYSRMGASDRILAGESTFMVEMKETAHILREANERSFVLIDEIGRGTSTTDGLSIARAVLEYVVRNVQALCVFATHYHELSDDAARLDSAFNASMGIKEWKGSLVFLRKLIYEPAQSSYGLHVAQWAGLPSSVLKAAKVELARLTEIEKQNKFASDDQDQMNLFQRASQAEDPSSETSENSDDLQPDPSQQERLDFLKSLEEVDLDSLSPREAWQRLDELVANAKSLAP